MIINRDKYLEIIKYCFYNPLIEEDDGMINNFSMTNITERTSTGVEGLDNLLNGGYPKGCVILVSGTPGTGKTIICFQFLYAGLIAGEKALYLSSDEPIQNLLQEAERFGMNLQQYRDNDQLKLLYLDTSDGNIYEDIKKEITNIKYDRIVVDSLSPLAETPMWMVSNGHEIVPSPNSINSISYPVESIQAKRMHLRRLIGDLKNIPATVLVTSEIPEGSRSLSRDSISEFLADGIILLDLDTTMDRRKLIIRKMRRTKHTLKPQNVEITENGIKII